MPETTITVGQSAQYGVDPWEETCTITVCQEGERYFYRPDHIGDTVMTSKGYAEVFEVTDHPCSGLAGCGNTCGGKHLSDECCVEEIDLPGYSEES